MHAFLCNTVATVNAATGVENMRTIIYDQEGQAWLVIDGVIVCAIEDDEDE